MLLPRNLSLTQMAIGAVASLVLVKVARPALVGVVRVGFGVKDLAQDTWNKAKAEVNHVKEEAKHQRPDASNAAVVADLQAQVQALKSQLASKKA
jgi:hypothetical protein